MKRGFTLIELLVTLAIIGTLVGVGIFFYSGYTVTAKENACFQNFENLKRKINANYSLCKLKANSGILKLQGQFWQGKPGNNINFSCNNSFESIADMTVKDFTNYAKNHFEDFHGNIRVYTYIGDPPTDGDIAYYPETAGFMLRVKCNGKVKRYQWPKSQ